MAKLTEKDTALVADFVNTTGDPVFDDTLRKALTVGLLQSPFLNVFSDEKSRQTLKLMGKAPDERITAEIGREICQRNGVKALLVGSVANLGSQYVITLDALNAATGDTLAQVQGQAASKEQVLNTLDKTTTELRGKLGESLASIQKFDKPLGAGDDVFSGSAEIVHPGRCKTFRIRRDWRHPFLQACRRTGSEFCHGLRAPWNYLRQPG